MMCVFMSTHDGQKIHILSRKYEKNDGLVVVSHGSLDSAPVETTS